MNDKRVFKCSCRLQVLVEIVLGCLGLFGNSLEMAFKRGSSLCRLLNIVLGCLGIRKQFGNGIHQNFIKEI